MSQKQREARKRYREEHPDLFPTPEPTAPKDPSKRKKKENKFKRKKTVSKDPNKPIKRGFRKHPLRVPGMKPGDSCFICKAQDHIAKLCPKKAEWEKNKVCFCFDLNTKFLSMFGFSILTIVDFFPFMRVLNLLKNRKRSCFVVVADLFSLSETWT